jgi:L-2-hydroxyglutarate oxidase LhgO
MVAGSPDLSSRVVASAARAGGGMRLLVAAADSPAEAQAATALRARSVVLCAGLATRALLRQLRGVHCGALPRQRLAKGSYFALAPAVPVPFARLVYPLPQDGGLGVHATLDLAGRLRFGPDVQWLPEDAGVDDELASVAALDFRVDPARAQAFQAAAPRSTSPPFFMK